jgi:lycopene beta-cyclase
MIAEKKYDYIFAGKGASAALVLIELERRNLLNSKNILIVDPNQNSTNNKNFCFWTEDNGEFKKKLEPFIEHNWSKIQLNNGKEEYLKPTSYNHIPNSIVIEKANEIIEKYNAQVLIETVTETGTDNLGNFATIGGERIYGEYIFDSRTPVLQKTEWNQTTLFQSFIGWVVEFPNEKIDVESFRMMDFNIEQNNFTQFVYVLPFSENSALVEVTRFGKEIIITTEAEAILEDYITNQFGEYKKLGIEQGCIPMSNAPLSNLGSSNTINLGARNYCLKPSTGYAFKNMYSQAVEIAESIQRGQAKILTNRTHEEASKGRFAFYDSLLLIILHLWPSYGKKIFAQLFSKIETKLILKFLDEKTSLSEDIKIFSRLPIGIFLRALALYFIKSKAFRPFLILCFVCIIYLLADFPGIQNIVGYTTLFIGMVCVGIPHGAVDHLIESKSWNFRKEPRFIGKYLALMACMGIFWLFAPTLALIAFLIYSGWHFGQADVKHWSLPKCLTLPWGVTLLLYILGTHQAETSQIVNYIAGIDFPISITPIAIAPWILFALWRRNMPLIFTLSWLAFSSQLPLLLAFGTYFIGQHSITSWRHLKQHIILENKKIWIHSLPFHLGAWIILILFFVVWPSIQNQINAAYDAWGIFFIFISCVSFPHVIFMNKLYKKRN